MNEVLLIINQIEYTIRINTKPSYAIVYNHNNKRIDYKYQEPNNSNSELEFPITPEKENDIETIIDYLKKHIMPNRECQVELGHNYIGEDSFLSIVVPSDCNEPFKILVASTEKEDELLFTRWYKDYLEKKQESITL